MARGAPSHAIYCAAIALVCGHDIVLLDPQLACSVPCSYAALLREAFNPAGAGRGLFFSFDADVTLTQQRCGLSCKCIRTACIFAKCVSSSSLHSIGDTWCCRCRYATMSADTAAAGRSLHDRADPRFYWNKHLTQKLLGGLTGHGCHQTRRCSRLLQFGTQPIACCQPCV